MNSRIPVARAEGGMGALGAAEAGKLRPAERRCLGLELCSYSAKTEILANSSASEPGFCNISHYYELNY